MLDWIKRATRHALSSPPTGPDRSGSDFLSAFIDQALKVTDGFPGHKTLFEDLEGLLVSWKETEQRLAEIPDKGRLAVRDHLEMEEVARDLADQQKQLDAWKKISAAEAALIPPLLQVIYRAKSINESRSLLEFEARKKRAALEAAAAREEIGRRRKKRQKLTGPEDLTEDQREIAEFLDDIGNRLADQTEAMAAELPIEYGPNRWMFDQSDRWYFESAKGLAESGSRHIAENFKKIRARRLLKGLIRNAVRIFFSIVVFGLAVDIVIEHAAHLSDLLISKKWTIRPLIVIAFAAAIEFVWSKQVDRVIGRMWLRHLREDTTATYLALFYSRVLFATSESGYWRIVCSLQSSAPERP